MILLHLQDILIPVVISLLPLFTYLHCVIGKELSYFFKNVLRNVPNLLFILSCLYISFQLSFSNANSKFCIVSLLICLNLYLWTIFWVLTWKFSNMKIWPESDKPLSAGRSWKSRILLLSKNKLSISKTVDEPILVGKSLVLN
jgi:hypothetical protein